jgi:hypothetical protein
VRVVFDLRGLEDDFAVADCCTWTASGSRFSIEIRESTAARFLVESRWKRVIPMASFTATPVEKGSVRYRHTGAFISEEARAFARFLYDYRGKLLAAL